MVNDYTQLKKRWKKEKERKKNMKTKLYRSFLTLTLRLKKKELLKLNSIVEKKQLFDELNEI